MLIYEGEEIDDKPPHRLIDPILLINLGSNKARSRGNLLILS